MQSHNNMKAGKALGIDNVTKYEYEANLGENIEDLVGRMKRNAYRPQPARRVYIPKPGSNNKRPLGIPAYEDKLVQAVLAEILNAIYEQDFLECSFGFRPNRGCHDALQLLDKILNKPGIYYIVDTDIKGFFDNIDHEWMMMVTVRLISWALPIMSAGIRTAENESKGKPARRSTKPVY